MMKEEWLLRGAVVPVNMETTASLVAEIKRLIDVVGGMALAQPEQEPVAWRTFDGEGGYDYRAYEMNENYDDEWAERNPKHKGWVEPLFTSPPQREWVGLTDKEIYEAGLNARNTSMFVHFIEAKLKELNV